MSPRRKKEEEGKVKEEKRTFFRLPPKKTGPPRCKCAMLKSEHEQIARRSAQGVAIGLAALGAGCPEYREAD